MPAHELPAAAMARPLAFSVTSQRKPHRPAAGITVWLGSRKAEQDYQVLRFSCGSEQIWFEHRTGTEVLPEVRGRPQ